MPWKPKSRGKIASKKVAEILRSMGADVPFPDDKEYHMISLRTFADLMVLSGAPEFKYIPEERDCDDFSKIVRGEMSKKGWGTFLIMKTKIRRANGKSHSLLSTLVKDGDNYKLILGEPQKGKIVDEPGYTLIRVFI